MAYPQPQPTHCLLSQSLTSTLFTTVSLEKKKKKIIPKDSMSRLFLSLSFKNKVEILVIAQFNNPCV